MGEKTEQQAACGRSTEYLTVSDVAVELRVSGDTIYSLIHRGVLKGVNLAPGAKRGLFRIKREWLDEFIHNQQTMPAPVKPERRHRLPPVRDLAGFGKVPE